MIELGPGEKGVSGVPGPVVLVVPAEVRLTPRVFVLIGLTMLEEPELSDAFECEDASDGCESSAALGPLLENRPMFCLNLCSRRNYSTYNVDTSTFLSGRFRERNRPVGGQFADRGAALVTYSGAQHAASEGLQLDAGLV
jgi:hypothetical protein